MLFSLLVHPDRLIRLRDRHRLLVRTRMETVNEIISKHRFLHCLVGLWMGTISYPVRRRSGRMHGLGETTI
jgi:hypothetical protein